MSSMTGPRFNHLAFWAEGTLLFNILVDSWPKEVCKYTFLYLPPSGLPILCHELTLAFGLDTVSASAAGITKSL